MPHRFRLLAAGLSAAVAGTVLAVAPTTAPAARAAEAVGAVEPAATQTVDYACQQYLVGLPVGAPFDLPLSLGVLDRVTVPLGGTVGTITGAVGLSGLTRSLADLLRTLLGGTRTLTFTLADSAYAARLDDTALTLPDLPVPAAAGSYDLLAPARFDLSRTLGGVLTKVTCAVDEADRLVTTLVVEAPPAPPTGAGGSTDAPAGPVSTGGGTTPVAVVDPTTPNPCVTTPAARAGQRRTRLTTKAAAVSWRRRPAVRVTAKARRKAARGTVIACYGAMQVGHKRLRHGRAVVRTLRFYPGRYRVRVVYLGSAAARAKARTITLRVRR